MDKEKIKILLECIFVLFVMFTYNLFFNYTFDQIIDFTHCYSMVNGLKIYVDFNIVVGPVYPTLMAVFLKIFGNNIIIFDFINALLVVGIYLLIRKDNKKTIAIFPIVILCYALIAKYNTFTLLLFYLIYYTEKNNNKHRDIIIGFLLGILAFTKINIAFALIIPTFVLYIKEYKIILKRALVFLITSLIIILIMWGYGILDGFINYTILGLLDFNNKYYDIAIVFLILIIVYILKNIKKDKMLIYMLCYLIMCYPLIETYHITNAIFPTIVYIADKQLPYFKSKNINKIRKIIIGISIVLYIILLMINREIIDINFKCKDRYCFQAKSYTKTMKYIHEINENIKDRENYRVFYLTNNAYLHKLDLNQKIDKFDYIWVGNLGYNGEEKIIKEIEKICTKEKCLFLIDKKNMKKSPINQNSMKILRFVVKKYKEKYCIKVKNAKFYIYSNE